MPPPLSTTDPIALIVTGASRGLGKAIYEKFRAECNVQQSILVARTPIDHDAEDPTVQSFAVDLACIESLETNIQTILEAIPSTNHVSRVVLVNNAGSVTPIGPAVDLALTNLQSAWDLNVTSALMVSLKTTKYCQQQLNLPLTIIHISSLVALQPFPTLSIYSAGKAARDAFHTALATEEESVDILQYAPGPLETSMTDELRRAASRLDPALATFYAQPQVDPHDSAARLMRILRAGRYTSGQHVDYYDDDDTVQQQSSG